MLRLHSVNKWSVEVAWLNGSFCCCLSFIPSLFFSDDSVLIL